MASQSSETNARPSYSQKEIGNEEGGLASLLFDCLVLRFDFLKGCTHTLQGRLDVPLTCHGLRRLCRMAKYVADGQFRNFQFVEHGRQPSPKSMHSMPLDTRLLCLGNDDVPTQMPEVKRLLRVGGRVKDEAGAAVPLQMRVEIFLHDSDYRYGGLAANRLRIFNQLALHDGPLDVQDAFVSVVIRPAQPFEFF